MRVPYVAALLAVAALSVAGSVIVSSMVARERLTGEVINIAGRQRMLSQRIGMLLSTSDHRQANDAQLDEAVDQFATAHEWLREPPAGAEPEAVRALAEGDAALDDTVERVLALIAAAHAGDEAARRQAMALLRGPLLEQLEQQVAIHTQASRDAIDAAVRLERVLLACVLLLLLVEALFIFRPLQGRLSRALEASRQALRQVEEREVFLREVFHVSGDGFALVDERGRAVTTSRRMSEWFPALENEPLWDVLFADDVDRETARTWFADANDGQFRGGMPDFIEQGTQAFEVQTLVQSVRPLRVLVIVRNVSAARALFVEQRKREEAEEQARLSIAERVAALSTLATGVAHEINNPATWMLANTTYVLEEIGRDTPRAEVRRALEDVLEGVRRIRHLVDDVQKLGNTTEDTVGGTDPVEAVSRVLRLASGELHRRARIEQELGPAPAVAASDVKLAHVLLNLLNNAVQSMPARPADENRIWIRTRTTERKWAEIEVEDNGRGMPDDVARRAFHPFFTTTPVGRRGLGLSVCHAIVTSIGGELSFRTREGGGTTFRIALPPVPSDFTN